MFTSATAPSGTPICLDRILATEFAAVRSNPRVRPSSFNVARTPTTCRVQSTTPGLVLPCRYGGGSSSMSRTRAVVYVLQPSSLEYEHLIPTNVHTPGDSEVRHDRPALAVLGAVAVEGAEHVNVRLHVQRVPAQQTTDSSPQNRAPVLKIAVGFLEHTTEHPMIRM
eukprot:4868329-Pyramimonas_sp.AAC.1